MTEDLEQALRRTLAAVAERAPKAPADIAAAPRRARRIRRARTSTQITLVAAAVLTIAGGTAVLTRTPAADRHTAASSVKAPADHPNPTPGTRGAAGRPRFVWLTPQTVAPVAQVWPAAVHRVPDTLANGRRFTPETFLDDHTMLVATDSSYEKVDALYRYDLRTHAVTRLAEVAAAPGATMLASGFTAGSGYVAWWLSTRTTTQIWGVPATGGTPHLIATQSGPSGASGLAIDGGDAVWSVKGVGGVYRAPLTGGAPRMVPGSAGMHILTWPWIGAPARLGPGRSAENGTTAFARIRNVLTGQTRTASAPGGDRWACSVTWCVGGRTAMAGALIRRRDGTGRQVNLTKGTIMLETPALDRFVIVLANGVQLYDLRTGRAGDLGVRRNLHGALTFAKFANPANRLYYTQVPSGYLVIDLGAI